MIGRVAVLDVERDVEHHPLARLLLGVGDAVVGEEREARDLDRHGGVGGPGLLLLLVLPALEVLLHGQRQGSSGHAPGPRRWARRRGRGTSRRRARSARTLAATVARVPGLPANSPMNRLREAPTTTGRPIATISSRRAISSRLCSSVLPNPIPGVEPDPLLGDPGAVAKREPLLEEGLAPRRRRRRSGGRPASCGGRRACASGRRSAPALGDHARPSSGSPRSAVTSLTNRAPEPDRPPRDRPPWRCRSRSGSRPRDPLEHRHHPPQLLLDGDGLRRRAGSTRRPRRSAPRPRRPSARPGRRPHRPPGTRPRRRTSQA